MEITITTPYRYNNNNVTQYRYNTRVNSNTNFTANTQSAKVLYTKQFKLLNTAKGTNATLQTNKDALTKQLEGLRTRLSQIGQDIQTAEANKETSIEERKAEILGGCIAAEQEVEESVKSLGLIQTIKDTYKIEVERGAAINSLTDDLAKAQKQIAILQAVAKSASKGSRVMIPNTKYCAESGHVFRCNGRRDDLFVLSTAELKTLGINESRYDYYLDLVAERDYHGAYIEIKNTHYPLTWNNLANS